MRPGACPLAPSPADAAKVRLSISPTTIAGIVGRPSYLDPGCDARTRRSHAAISFTPFSYHPATESSARASHGFRTATIAILSRQPIALRSAAFVATPRLQLESDLGTGGGMLPLGRSQAFSRPNQKQELLQSSAALTSQNSG